MLEQQGVTGPFRDWVEDAGFDPLYHAPALVVIYAVTGDHYAQVDCCLAAENLMLAARDAGLGTGWIGGAALFFNLPAVKDELGVPQEYSEIAALTLGYPTAPFEAMERAAPRVAYWSE